MKAYFFSGLGADKRAFKYIELPGNFEAVHIDWIEPARNEPIESYAARLAGKIDTSEDFILIGLSFGGIIACEIARMLPPKMVIIFSSITTRAEMPTLYKLAGMFHLYKLLPFSCVKKSYRFLYWVFGPLTTDAQNLLNTIIGDTDPEFSKWAIGEIVRWQVNVKPPNCFQFHGRKDKTFPKSKADYYIENAGHLMVYTHAAELNKALAKVLSENIALKPHHTKPH